MKQKQHRLLQPVVLTPNPGRLQQADRVSVAGLCLFLVNRTWRQPDGNTTAAGLRNATHQRLSGLLTRKETPGIPE
jgi:hypothetical protein